MTILPQKNIFLLGFMAVGKTKVGRLIAQELNWTFVDTDDLIVQNAGMSIPDIFSKHGEPHFRLLETEAVENVCNRSKQVIALGGGAVIKDDNWDMIKKNGSTVTLSYPAEIIAKRTSLNNDRPLLSQETPEEQLKKIQSLLKKREFYYRRADMVLHLNQEIPAEQVAQAILGYLGAIH